MLEFKQYVKLLNFLDEILWDQKFTDTNWMYNGLVLDYYFDMSILSIDYLNIEDYFEVCSNLNFKEDELLYDQFQDIEEDKRIKLIESVLNIFKCSSHQKNISENVLQKSIAFLERNNIEVENPVDSLLRLSKDNIIDQGSYCIIRKVKEGILQKELNSIYSGNSEFQKRMKYEFENMNKLKDCPQVLKVLNYDPKTFSYLMERADKNLDKYLREEVDISFEKKIKIIYDILNGMKCAHEEDIIHRDLHLGNVLKIGNDFVLCDFGLSKDESIERSLKSSATMKNNHIFVDPLGMNDFTKLDKKSDIYSLGKIIDYIFTSNSTDNQHSLTFVVDKCTNRNKNNRYDSVGDILKDIEVILNQRDTQLNQRDILEKIQNKILDPQVAKFIDSLVKTDRICDYIVKHNLSMLGKVILQLEQVIQIEVLEAIDASYSEATGYSQFQNYDIFASIAYHICDNSSEIKVYSIAYNILKGCANYRYTAADYLKLVDKKSF